MKVTLIGFHRGSGGNFLARVLTLDDKTVPIGPNPNLNTKERLSFYRYEDKKFVKPFNKIGSDGLSNWVRQELNEFYFPLTLGIEKLSQLQKHVIEPVHLDHMLTKCRYFGPDDEVEIVYLDPSDCIDWMSKQILHKINSNYEQIRNIKKNIFDDEKILIENFTIKHKIFLKDIISNEDTFLSCYIKICSIIGVRNYNSMALALYNDWRATWA